MSEQSPDALEHEFFTALINADATTLSQVLADDFLLIDVMTGSEIPRSALLEVVETRQLRFERIDRSEHRVRVYETTAIITGRTEMRGSFGEQTFQTSSRYTHVFVEKDGPWRMVTAQGTQIASPPSS